MRDFIAQKHGRPHKALIFARRCIPRIMTQLLEDILSMSLSYLGSEHRPHSHDWMSRDEKDNASLFDIVFFLVEQEQFWAAKKLSQIIFCAACYRLSVDVRDRFERAQSNDKSI